MKNKREFTQQLGSTVRLNRQKAGYSIASLASRAGMTYSQVARIELGKISTSAHTLFVLSEALGIKTYELLDSLHQSRMEEQHEMVASH
ncbi:MAG: helix-turn-helix domain-containing protein [Cyclobacteriaceae bacterium]|nr:helix-turn-helix domain-containing protein [Cyclobacteriaceae bacterium]